MKLLIVLLTGLATVLADTSIHTGTHHQWQGDRYRCRWIKNEFKCLYQNCIVAFDGKQRCTTRIGPPTAEIYAKLSNRSSQCSWINGKVKCMYRNCRFAPDGEENCTSTEGPLPGGIDQKRLASHTTNTNCKWSSGKLICTKESCTIYPNGKKSCSTRTL